MRNKIILTLAIMLFGLTILNAQTKTDVAHTPNKGSAERQAILDALRTEEAARFQVNFMRVHSGWVWTDVTPLDKTGKPSAEGGPELLHFEDGKWIRMDLSKVPEDPKDPMGAEDASVGFVRNLRKTFPGVPSDIFPKPSH